MTEEDEITLQDLLDDEPAGSTLPQTYAELLADGFPPGGGMAALAAVQNLADPDPGFGNLKDQYRQLLERQRRAKPAQG